MLTHLEIKNFTTVEHLALDFDAGFTTITGETGAGKSVMLDAVALALGGRNSRQCLRDENSAAEFTACFSLPAGAALHAWLEQKELPENDGEILCRRIIKPDGRSRAYVNGGQVTIADLRDIGKQLVDLHGQHEHQSLLIKASHQQMLDEFGKHAALAREVATLAQACSHTRQEINRLLSANADSHARQQLLAYQVGELDQLALAAGETDSLAAEQKMLANAESLLAQLQRAVTLCDSDNEGALSAVKQALAEVVQSTAALPTLQSASDMLESATIQIEEALAEINARAETVHIDPQRLQHVEHRLDEIYAIARKHNLQPEQLTAQHEQLSQELAALENSDETIANLEEKLQQQHALYSKKAATLSRKRKSAAKKLVAAVHEKLASLKMEHCEFAVDLAANDATAMSPQGLEGVEFLIATVPGKAPQPLAKIASGGELSRISLAIQVVTAQPSDTPTLVFDEVEVGIGGGVAEVVGNLLRELGENCQVFCVTHLAQVAAKGSQHLLVAKQVSSSSATTQIKAMDKAARKAELARMLGGLDVTASTIAHASEMLESA